MQRTLKTLAVIVALTATSADADFISWDQFTFPTTGNGSGVLLTTGSYEAAWNVGDPATVTVDGIAFRPNGIGNAGPNGVWFSFVGASSTTSGSGYDAPFNGIMERLGFSASNFTVTLNDLTPGQEYRVQFLSYQNIATNRSTRIHFGPDNTGPSTGFFNPNSSGGPYSNTLLFSADAATQDFFFTGNSTVPLVNAISVFAVPEPGSFAILAPVGLLTAFWWRSKARKRCAIGGSKSRGSMVASLAPGD